MSLPASIAWLKTRPARIAGACLFGGALSLLAALALRPPPAARAAGARLEVGKPVAREIYKGQTHVYEVEVPADRVVNGVVEQRGVDLQVRVIDPSGKTVTTVDSPNGMSGPEPWSLDGKTAGLWRLEVSPLDGPPSPGRYEARVDDVITFDERDERLAKLRYQSPRLQRLWREHRAEGAAAIERFAKEVDGHAPLVEPTPGDARGDVLITFVYRVPLGVRYAALLGGPLAGEHAGALARFEDGELMFLTLRAPRDARFTYNLVAGEAPRPGASASEMARLFSAAGPDPWNPRRFTGRSLVELPGAPPQAWAERVEGVPKGRIVERTLRSQALGEDRKLGVYLPDGFDPAGGPYPYVVVFDGEVYGLAPDAPVPTPTILDNLIARKKLKPTLAVLVDTQGTRDRDLPMSAPFADFLANELAPWVRREYRASADPAAAALAGSSFGGLAATYGAFRHPEVFGNVLSQSGSFWFSPGALEAETPYGVEAGAMMREFASAPPKPLHIWMEVGAFEGGGRLANTNQVAQSRHMRDVLVAKGYRVSYHEYAGGHDYACWRGSLADGLVALAEAGFAPSK